MMNFMSTSHQAWLIRDNRQRCLSLTGATMRSATSFWNVRVNGTRPYDHAFFLQTKFHISHNIQFKLKYESASRKCP